MNNKNLEIVSAVRSNYKGMMAMFSYNKKVYLGKIENYHFNKKDSAYYDNTDNSLCFISNNHKIFTFLYGAGWVLSQSEMLKHGFTMELYKEFDKLQNTILREFEKTYEILFKDIPFISPEELEKKIIEEEKKVA